MKKELESEKDLALMVATLAHDGQTRKYTGEPYVRHPMRVAQIVDRHSEDKRGKSDAICAALLHDVLEDTNVTLEILKEYFDWEVVGKVVALTDTPKEAGNRATRKAMDRDRLHSSNSWVQTIKLADLIDNTSSIVLHDPKFAKTYMEEKRELLKVLPYGDKHLYEWAKGLVDMYFAAKNAD